MSRELIDRANEIIDRLRALDGGISNACAFRALLEDLHARDLPHVEHSDVAPIAMVRAGILRAFIGSLMACLDPNDPRDNRASLGQIFEKLKAAQPVSSFKQDVASLQKADDEYRALLASRDFQGARRLRNRLISHLLVSNGVEPEVPYQTLYALQDKAEQLTISLFKVCGRRNPYFLDHRPKLKAHAKKFWDTYFSAM
jgi:hypothetical protein